MKTSYIVSFALLLAGCTCPRQSTSLTAEQAGTLAMRLANDEATALYHCQPFHDGRPARFMEGHWVWADKRGLGHEDIQVTVELASDGSTNNVDLKLIDSQNRLPFPQ